MAVASSEQQPLAEVRRPAHPVDARFVQRWSPRAFSPESVPRAHIDIMLEAARWAPSSMNEQPWRFYVTGDGPGRARLDAAIVPGNRAWSDAAPVIIWVVAKTTFARNDAPNRHAWFDAGAATMQLVLQASQMGYATHHMGGIDAHQAATALGLGDDEAVICAIALGRPGRPEQLPDALRQREAPSPRHAQEAFVSYL